MNIKIFIFNIKIKRFWSVSSNTCVSCPANWVIYRSGNSASCYLKPSTSLTSTFDDAQKYCQNLGGNLLVVNDDGEYNLLKTFFNSINLRGLKIWVIL